MSSVIRVRAIGQITLLLMPAFAPSIANTFDKPHQTHLRRTVIGLPEVPEHPRFDAVKTKRP